MAKEARAVWRLPVEGAVYLWTFLAGRARERLHRAARNTLRVDHAKALVYVAADGPPPS